MFHQLVGNRATTGGEKIGRSSQHNEAGKIYARKWNHALCGKFGQVLTGTTGPAGERSALSRKGHQGYNFKWKK